MVIIDWLLNGSVKDREDVYSIISSLQYTTEILNGIYGQIHNKIDSNQVKEDLYKDLKKVLSHKDKYGKLDTKNRVYVETRGWIIPILSICSYHNKDECKEILNKYMDPIVDVQTRFWAFYSYILNMDLDINDIRTKVNEIFELYNSKEEYNELYWCCQIWYLNNNDEEKKKKKKDQALEKITELLNNHTLTNIHLNFFVTFSYYKTPLIVRELTEFMNLLLK